MSYFEYHVARRYVQFEGALGELPNYAALVGSRVLILTACDPIRERVETQIRDSLERPAAHCMNPRLARESVRCRRYASIAERLDALRREMEFSFFNLGECVVSEDNVRRVAAHAEAQGIDTVVGIGGGRGQDFARALTHFVPVKVILVPTLTATNASISTLSVIYSQDGKSIEQYWRMDSAPDLVLADTEIIIQKGPGVLAAGIGDIACTYYEALCNLRLAGGVERLPALSYQSVELAIEILRELVPDAMSAARERRITPAFESVVSMILHNSSPMGMICTMGFAHVLDEVFLYFDAAHAIPHGLRVGYATIPMLLYQGAGADEVHRYMDFCKRAGIPTSLDELGLAGIEPIQWMKAFDATAGRTGTLDKLPFQTTAQALIGSLAAAQRFTKQDMMQVPKALSPDYSHDMLCR